MLKRKFVFFPKMLGKILGSVFLGVAGIASLHRIVVVCGVVVYI